MYKLNVKQNIQPSAACDAKTERKFFEALALPNV